MTEKIDHPMDVQNNAAAQTDQFDVQSFTIRYDPVEDRIFLSAADAKGTKQAIYLTRRLLDQIIPVVVKHLESRTPSGIPADIVQSMTQENIRLARQAEPKLSPIVTEISTPRWLCSTVKIGKQPAGLMMTFTDDAGSNARLNLGEAHLRTVLDIFYDGYTQGNWDRKIFPNWHMSDPLSAIPARHIKLN